MRGGWRMIEGTGILECVINISEGRDLPTVTAIADSADVLLLDVHTDADHNRSVLTLCGSPDRVEDAARAVARSAVAALDIGHHAGVHPRLGVLDVVPFVNLEGFPLGDGPLEAAVDVRDRFARWAGEELLLPCFLYGPERSLPDVRRAAWDGVRPDTGPARPHPTAGSAAVGARPLLVAYNLWLGEPDLALARSIATALRGPELRTLALSVGSAVQVSCNLIAPRSTGPEAVFDAVASRAGVERAELVGLLPSTVLDAIPRHRWRELGLAPSMTIEARLEQAGLDGGRITKHDD